MELELEWFTLYILVYAALVGVVTFFVPAPYGKFDWTHKCCPRIVSQLAFDSQLAWFLAEGCAFLFLLLPTSEDRREDRRRGPQCGPLCAHPVLVSCRALRVEVRRLTDYH